MALPKGRCCTEIRDRGNRGRHGNGVEGIWDSTGAIEVIVNIYNGIGKGYRDSRVLAYVDLLLLASPYSMMQQTALFTCRTL